MNRFKPFICLIVLISLFTSCTFNSVTSAIVTPLRFLSVKKETPIHVINSPEQSVDVDEHAEYFKNLETYSDYSYSDYLKTQLKSRNMIYGSSSSRFELDICSITFEESSHRECEDRESKLAFINEDCFWLNDLTVSVKIKVTDQTTGKSRSFESYATESTRIKSRLIGNGHKESNIIIGLNSVSEAMLKRAIYKCVGKASRYIRKRQRRENS